MEKHAVDAIELTQLVAGELQLTLRLKAWTSCASVKLVQPSGTGRIAVLLPELLDMVELGNALLCRECSAGGPWRCLGLQGLMAGKPGLPLLLVRPLFRRENVAGGRRRLLTADRERCSDQGAADNNELNSYHACSHHLRREPGRAVGRPAAGDIGMSMPEVYQMRTRFSGAR